ncbi:uncharacterized protein si:ch211-264f5.2 isoform X2 [Triplophysa rosa]|uniref:Ig-like domain-containing protein n=1 Tax=Triplophysa rosa TaxID=992332 RepID=A0A9W7WG65_TRIRA|nr:uncharacterized protein si:ch211-264f5.2 isoform X2 [Triplophysa rosa]KAI7798511.1 hypothetical protein IRJ41_005150 [Triplophysa rosa]
MLSIIVLLLEVQGISCLWTVSKITAKSGGFVTIPCHYHRLYRDNPKYWCKGRNWLTCVTMQTADQKEKRPGVSFHNNQDELVITMTMTNLRSSDSNRYWCAVKKRGVLRSDIGTSLELTVTEGMPDLSVASSMVSSVEGGNITVECLYSKKLRDAEKKWCRSGDRHSCQTAQDIEPSPDAAVQINDTNDGVFRVMLTGLKKTYAGWYWCMARELQAPVYINITSVHASTTNTRPSTSTVAPWSPYTPIHLFTVYPSTHSSSPTSFDVNNHNTEATMSPTTSELPERTSYKQWQISTASSEQLSSTVYSSTYPTTKNSSSSHWSGITLPTSRSATTNVGSGISAVTVSSEDLKSDFKGRDRMWVIVLCGALLLLVILPGISWKLWSWHKKSNTREDATEITAEVLKLRSLTLTGGSVVFDRQMMTAMIF